MGRKKLNQDQLIKTKLIIKGSSQSHYKSQTIVDFKVAKDNCLYPKALDNPVFPVFSNDGKYYTPSFILAKVSQLKEQDCLNVHNTKVQESLIEIEQDQIMMAKPSAKSQYCGICRVCYEDYLEHIQSPQHVKGLSQAKYQKQILGLCSFFDNHFLKSDQTQIIKKTSTQTKINEDESYTQCFIEERKFVV